MMDGDLSAHVERCEGYGGVHGGRGKKRKRGKRQNTGDSRCFGFDYIYLY